MLNGKNRFLLCFVFNKSCKELYLANISVISCSWQINRVIKEFSFDKHKEKTSIFAHQYCFSALSNFDKIGKIFCEKKMLYMAFCYVFMLLNFFHV